MKKVLLILDDCGAGDALRLAGHVHSVRLAFPAARLLMIASASAAAAYERSPDIDRVIPSSLYGARQGRGDRVGKATELLRLAVAAGVDNDLAITFWWGSRLLRWLARICCRGLRVGYGEPPVGPYDFSGDEMLQNSRLLEAAGVRHTGSGRLPRVQLGDGLEPAATTLLRDSGWDGRSRIAILHTGSDWACQQWSQLRWAALADTLVAEYGVHVVFTGTAPERDYVRKIRAAMNHRSASVVGETPLPLLTALVRSAQLLITVDSAAYVIARSQGVPVVVLAGPSHPERLLSGATTASVVKRMDAGTAAAIDACKRPKFPAGGCHDYTCPLGGLRELAVDDVLGAVRSSGALERRLAAV